MGFGTLVRVKLVTATSEIGRNTPVHGGGRMTIVEVTNDNFQQGLRLIFEGQDPGIQDIDRSLADGYPTAKSRGSDWAKRMKPIMERIAAQTDIRNTCKKAPISERSGPSCIRAS